MNFYELSFWYGRNEIVIGTYRNIKDAEKHIQQFIDDVNREYDIVISKWNNNLNMYMPVKSL